jgi:hypothetical protein
LKVLQVVDNCDVQRTTWAACNSSPIFRSSLVIWKTSPQGHEYVKACISSFHSKSSISTSSYDILLSVCFLSLLSLWNTFHYQSMIFCHSLSLSTRPPTSRRTSPSPGVSSSTLLLNHIESSPILPETEFAEVSQGSKNETRSEIRETMFYQTKRK